jgi:nucleoside-diphosphate-sugar epimerase
MLGLANLMARIGATELGYSGKVVSQPSSEAEFLADNPTRRSPDITKARSDLGYDPLVSLDEGILQSLIWYAAPENSGGGYA